MTKITDLDNLPGSLAGSAVIPGVQSGTTYGITADQIKAYVDSGGSTGSGSGTTKLSTATAVPILTRDMVYGVPRKVSIISGGNTGYENADAEIMCCGHVAGQGLVYGTEGPGGDTNYNAAEYLARGLAVKCTVTGGVITSVRIINPGQMYRVGDQLDITLQKSIYSTTGTGTVIAGANFSPCKVRIDEVEPFMGGGVTSEHHAMGSAAPHVTKSGKYGAEIVSGTSFSRKNPLRNIGGSLAVGDGDYFAMEQDWASPLFMKHAQDGTDEAAPTGSTTTGSNLNAADQGIDYVHVGSTGLESVASQNYILRTSAISRQTIDVAVPGVWIIVWQCKVNGTAPANTGNMYNNAADSTPQERWLTVDQMIPEYTAGQLKINGNIITGNGIWNSNSIDLLVERSELHATFPAALNITKSDIATDIQTKATTPTTIGSVAYNGVYNPTQDSSFVRDTDNTTTCFTATSNQTIQHQSAGQAQTRYEQYSFYLVNAFDLLG